MCLWVDADSFPRQARHYIQQTAIQHKIKLVYVANKRIPFDFDSPLFSAVIQPSEKNAADNYIFDNCNENDIVFTRDIEFAKRLSDKKITALNDRGAIFDTKTLAKMLKEKALSEQMELLGLHTGKSRHHYGRQELEAFIKTFNTVLEQTPINGFPSSYPC